MRDPLSRDTVGPPLELQTCLTENSAPPPRGFFFGRPAVNDPPHLTRLCSLVKAQINKTDRNDARGIAQTMRAGLYRPVHVKTLPSQKLRMLLTHRKLLQSKAIAIENDLRATLGNFGLKVGVVGTVKFEARIKELVENLPDLAILVEPLLIRFVGRAPLSVRTPAFRDFNARQRVCCGAFLRFSN